MDWMIAPWKLIFVNPNVTFVKSFIYSEKKDHVCSNFGAVFGFNQYSSIPVKIGLNYYVVNAVFFKQSFYFIHFILTEEDKEWVVFICLFTLPMYSNCNCLEKKFYSVVS